MTSDIIARQTIAPAATDPRVATALEGSARPEHSRALGAEEVFDETLAAGHATCSRNPVPLVGA
jgi:hypothetical protein